MIVVGDTSILTNLIQLDRLILLQDLFGNLLVPEKVFDELAMIESQASILKKSSWIQIRKIVNRSLYEKLIKQLDGGEAEAIVLAIEVEADLLLMDERKGRLIAQQFDLSITGLIGILIEAKQQGFIDHVKPMLEKLIFEMGFRVKPSLYQEIISIVGE